MTTSYAGTPNRIERLDLEAGYELLEIAWRAIPLRTFADLKDELSERGRGALERYSVVPSILLPPHTPFSRSPLPFRLVLIRSQHILSGPWKPTQLPNGFEEILPVALAFSPRLCGIDALLTHLWYSVIRTFRRSFVYTGQGPHSRRMTLHRMTYGCSAIHTSSRRLAIRSMQVEANVRRLGHPSHGRMLAVFSGHGPSRESTLRRSDKSEAASLTSVERSAFLKDAPPHTEGTEPRSNC